VEITAESENWRRIRDSDGTEGWVYHSLLSGKRTGLVTAKAPDDLVPVHAKPDKDSAVVAKLERGVVGAVKRCDDGWCAISGRGFDGWIQQVRLWGVYPDEKVD
jgi:SH3-like domain-containing protein